MSVEEEQKDLVVKGPLTISKPHNFSMWAVILAMYLFLLISIGFVAFWEQDFNRTDKTVANYVKVLNELKQNQGAENQLTEKEMMALITELIKHQADTSGDIQELASQSFNIILGAILAFLSASATMIFQRATQDR